MKATSAGWTPAWYSQYRFYLSILVGSCILGTLFGLNYLGPTTDVVLRNPEHFSSLRENALGPGASHMEALLMPAIDKARGDGPGGQKRFSAPEGSEYWTEEGEEGYVKIMKKTSDEDEDGEGESGESGDEAKEDGDDSEGEGDSKEKQESSDDSDSASTTDPEKSRQEERDGGAPESDVHPDHKERSQSKGSSDSVQQDNSGKGVGGPDKEGNEKMREHAENTKKAHQALKKGEQI